MSTRRSRAGMLTMVAALAVAAGACSKTETPPTTSGSTSSTAKTTGSTPGSTPGTAKPTGTTPGTAKPAGDPKAMMKDVKLVTAGQLTVCSDIPYAPFEFPDKDNGDKLTGFDVELVDHLAEDLGVKAEFKTTPFDSIITSLAADNCDMIASATTITAERKEKVLFTDPYFDADQSLLINKSDAGSIKGLDDLKDKVIGVQSGTTGADYAKEHKPEGATIKDFQGADDMFAALASGDVAALLQDFPVNKYRALKNADKLVVTETFATGEQYGFAVKKDNTKLAAALNLVLSQTKADGDYDEIYEKWFGKAEA